mmetsp:Transcript_18609/g.56168  ORF Transcript_18609/g.56168 Transcript_18609/m.56168 type:complete len:97 (+) Transcript_18609:499-789(+)|eukprot:scaffold43469_cov34-Tisochrysis_lutea.AAC.2
MQEKSLESGEHGDDAIETVQTNGRGDRGEVVASRGANEVRCNFRPLSGERHMEEAPAPWGKSRRPCPVHWARNITVRAARSLGMRLETTALLTGGA